MSVAHLFRRHNSMNIVERGYTRYSQINAWNRYVEEHFTQWKFHIFRFYSEVVSMLRFMKKGFLFFANYILNRFEWIQKFHCTDITLEKVVYWWQCRPLTAISWCTEIGRDLKNLGIPYLRSVWIAKCPFEYQ